MSDGTKELDASLDSPAAADPPEDYLEKLLRSLDDRRPEPSRCEGYALCGDWPW
ncbi:hypothetical protein AB0D04_00135 [Streptomyces sp. NPDC048483]|uniref:hypothetical protein n=1 Tax=Streptomyces sp. NPDC048483 TaxID=3154927 RepID=UPI00341A50CD